MKNTLAVLLFTVATWAFGADPITLPAAGPASAASIFHCEAQLASSSHFEKVGNGAYRQINVGADSFIYIFTVPTEPAHPAMIKITLHPMADPRQPQESEIEFFASYAGKETDFDAWSEKVLHDFGRGFATGVMENQ
ncbi:hypothetical protein [Pseudoduganella albidiflava]|uniref:Uncharacterized protein n=1 Tax=Pseudoduganella albidiflava TaxID=321983 RepID=A0A411WWU9_9BURK|nr:hypothetical protein [Pseudoduganella albidiflava]QBI01254.1 hypothetical protein EYF70_10690 [Pseudoduganella albidiflava]GGY49388.1 hypothetical protein GCM10007387_34600 [Pseudoduganella albidiflava]